jgi:CRP/FNR family cyclic AMP-dependent transcriptional regulator
VALRPANSSVRGACTPDWVKRRGLLGKAAEFRVYFVQAGRIKTLKITASGKELITSLYGPGEFFGYLTLLQRTPHRDSAVAVDDSELVYISQDDFSQLLLRYREVS